MLNGISTLDFSDFETEGNLGYISSSEQSGIQKKAMTQRKIKDKKDCL